MKKLLKKVISLTAALAMAAAYSVSAAVTTGGGTDSKPYYWQENFNDYTSGSYSYNTGTKPNCVVIPSSHTSVYVQSKAITAGSDYALEIKGDKIASGNQQVKIVTDVCNFQNGPVIVQFDATFAAAPQGFRMDLCDNTTTTLIGNIVQAKSSRWYAYPAAGSNAATQKTITTNTKYRFAAYLVYDKANDKINVKTFVDGNRLVKNSDQSPIEYDITGKSAVLGNPLVLRFYVYKNDDVVIDNVTVKNASTINLSNVGWIGTSSSASVGYTDTPAYTDSEGSTVLLTQGVINKITKASSSSQIILNKYNLADDPLLLSPMAQTANVSYVGTNNFTIANLTLNDAANEFYIAKINDASDFTSITGQATENEYVLLRSSSLTSAPIIRQTKLYGEGDTVLTLEDGKLPQKTKKIETVISYYSDVPETVKITGKGVNVSATAEGKTCTIDLSKSPLLPGEDYTVTVGTVSKTYTATGEKAKMDEAIETFGNSPSVTDELCSSSYITLDRSGNNLLYQNTLTSSTASATYKFQHPFNFEGGSKKMLVSFKVKLNQSIAYNSTESQSHLLLPNVKIGSKSVYMPAIEHSGFRARTAGGGRNTNKPAVWEYSEMQQNKVYTESVLVEYDSENSKLVYTQYINGKPLEIKNSTTEEVSAVGAFEIEDVTEADLNKDIEILFMGRNFAAGGLYIDDLAVTTVDKSFSVSQPVISEDNTVTVNAVNKTENLKPMYIILASYNGTELLDVEYIGADINFTDRQYQFVPSEEFNTTGATAIKAFVWNGFAGATPYAANAEK